MFRHATHRDVSTVVALLSDDMLGKARENAQPSRYLAAFEQMQQEGNNHLIVGEVAQRIVACYQIIFISGLSLSGARRAELEGVRVAADLRGQGLGQGLARRCRGPCQRGGLQPAAIHDKQGAQGCPSLLRATGFTPSHIGYKKFIRASSSPKYPS